MRNSVIVLCVVVILASGWQGSRGWTQWQSAKKEVSVLEGKIERLNERSQMLAQFKSRTPVALSRLYEDFLADISDIARLHLLGLSVEGGIPLFTDSAMEGLKEARIKVVFSRIPRRGSLLSVLAFLDAVANRRALVYEQVIQEKNMLTIEVRLVGV